VGGESAKLEATIGGGMMFRKTLYIFLLIMLSYTSLISMTIVVTINPYYLILKDMVKDRARILLLIEPGKNPHLYSPTIEDVKNLMKGDLIVANGLNLETFISPELSKLKKKGLNVLYLSDFIPRGELMGEKDRPNPHIWMDPVFLYRYIVPAILKELKRIDPKNSDFYERNAIDLIERLKKFDRFCREKMEKMKCKSILTAHPSLVYFARRYGIKVTSLFSGHGKQVTVKETMNVIRSIRKGEICAIFSEKGINSKAMEVIASETGLEIGTLDPLGCEANGILELFEKNLKELIRFGG